MTQNDDPQRSDKRRKTKVVAFRVTPEDLARLERGAANEGYHRPSTWARDVALEQAGGAGRDHRILPDLLRQIGKVGVNVNQMAKVANTTKAIRSEAELQEIMVELSDLMRRIGRALP